MFLIQSEVDGILVDCMQGADFPDTPLCPLAQTSLEHHQERVVITYSLTKL